MTRLFTSVVAAQRQLLLVVLVFLWVRTPSFAAEAAPSAYLAFACDGTANEQRVLREQAATWIVNQTRAFATNAGRVVYRVPLGTTELEGLRLEANVVPYRLEFSADGNHWETLMSTNGGASNPGEFITQGAGFTAAQREAARGSGYAWFCVRPAGGSGSGILQLQRFRVDVRGADLPPQFVRPSWWRQFAPFTPGVLMAVVGVLPVFIVWRRWRVTWRVWGAGAALWFLSVALKSGCALVTNGPVSRWLHAELPPGWAGPALWCYLGSLTGVFECGIFLVVAPLLRRRQWSWGAALSLGVGFGAIEALALGGAVTVSASQAGEWGCLPAGSEALVPALERLLALLIHVAAVVMVLRALVERNWRWFGASFAYKSAVDGVDAWLLLSGTSLRFSPWLMEWVCFGPFAAIGFLVLLHLSRRWMGPMSPVGALHSCGE